jgi:hypothetical protein
MGTKSKGTVKRKMIETKTALRAEKWLGRKVILSCSFRNYKNETVKGKLLFIRPMSYVLLRENRNICFIGKNLVAKIRILKKEKQKVK